MRWRVSLPNYMSAGKPSTDNGVIYATGNAASRMKIKYLFAGLFILAGITHFFKMDIYIKVIPPALPWPEAVVLISGAVSIVLGAGLLWPPTSIAAAWGIMAFLIAVFPSNIFMSLHPEIFPQVPVWVLWARLPLQIVLIRWAYRYTHQEDGSV